MEVKTKSNASGVVPHAQENAQGFLKAAGIIGAAAVSYYIVSYAAWYCKIWIDLQVDLRQPGANSDGAWSWFAMQYGYVQYAPLPWLAMHVIIVIAGYSVYHVLNIAQVSLASALSALAFVLIFTVLEVALLGPSGMPSGAQWLPFTMGAILLPAISSLVALGLVARRARRRAQSELRQGS